MVGGKGPKAKNKKNGPFFAKIQGAVALKRLVLEKRPLIQKMNLLWVPQTSKEKKVLALKMQFFSKGYIYEVRSKKVPFLQGP